MPVTIDQTDIGSAAIDATATTIPFTTTAVVASNGFIVVEVSNGSGNTVSAISGGSLTWAIDVNGTGNGAGCAICSAQAPAGLASGTVITATFSATSVGRGISGSSWTGVLSAAALDTTSGPTNFTGTTAWTTASTTIAAGSVLVAVGHAITSNRTSTPTAPSLETHDINGGAGTFWHGAEYRIETVGAAYTVAGTLDVADTGTVVAAAYKVGTATAAATTVLHQSVPFMSNGRI